MESRWWWISVLGIAVSMAAHAGTQSGGGADDLLNPPNMPFPFALPSTPANSDPWAAGGVCVPIGDGPWLPRRPARPRTHWAHPRPVPAAVPAAPAPAQPIPLQQPICVPEPPAHDIAMAAGPAFFNILTAGAPPNSSVTLRIDNRTTVTITVNADRGACAIEPGTVPRDASGTAPPPATPTSVGGIFDQPRWAALWAGGGGGLDGSGPFDHRFRHASHQRTGPPFSWKDDDDWDGRGEHGGHNHGGGNGGQHGGGQGGGGQSVALEPSTLLLLGSGVVGLFMLARRRR